MLFFNILNIDYTPICTFIQFFNLFYEGLFQSSVQFPCNCNLYFCYGLEMLNFQGKSEFGEEKIFNRVRSGK